MSHLKAVNDKVIESESSFIKHAPEYGAIRIPRRAVEPEVLKHVISALRNKQSIEICYESYSQAEISWRWISPHAFASDGSRWHVRAYCHRRSAFRDFVLGRIAEVRGIKNSQIDSAQDFDWHNVINVKLSVNKKLPETKQRIVERDYVMENRCLNFSIRRSLLYYLYYNLNFNKPTDSDLLVLEDKEAIESIIFKDQKV